MEWTEDVIIRLRLLWDEGHSTAEIGRRLGVSKNAIVGKAHRLDLPARPSPIRREPAAADAARTAPARRLEGSTLPPLASTDIPIPAIVPAPTSVVISVLVPPPVVVAAVEAVIEPPAPPPVAPAPLPPVMASRPVPIAVPRSSGGATRPYGRVITCCWPIGEPGTRGFRFCDSPSEPGKPYCGDHARLAYVKVRDRREDAA